MLARNPPRCLTFLYSGALGCRHMWLLTRGASKVARLVLPTTRSNKNITRLLPSSRTQTPAVALLRFNCARVYLLQNSGPVSPTVFELAGRDRNTTQAYRSKHPWLLNSSELGPARRSRRKALTTLIVVKPP